MDPVHPTVKPVDLLGRLISMSSKAGDTILDPFAGSGTTGRAAKDLGRKCTMIEREERYCEIAARRMAQEVLPL
jgi:DNA modification methylase